MANHNMVDNNLGRVEKFLELAARLHVFIFLNIYGSGKILGGQFYRKGTLPEEVAKTTLDNASAYDLAWTFMGYSNAYILFIGASQIIGAWCLLWNRTKFVGVTILFPILLNIVVFDIIFLDEYGALASASIYLILLVIIVVINKQVFFDVIKRITLAGNVDSSIKLKFRDLVICLLIVSSIFGIEQIFIYFLDH